VTTTIRPAVTAAFRGYTERLEGRTRNPYADVKGLVTVSFGCLIDPIGLALRLDWRIGDRAATAAEVRDDWQTVKAIGPNNRTATSQAALTSIRLSDAAVEALLWSRLAGNAEWLQRHLFPGFSGLSADAQLAILSTAWAIGCDFRHTDPPRPALIAAISAGDWLAAKVHAKLRTIGNAGVIDRNRHQERCFDNAATVAAHGLDPGVLHWPATVLPPVSIGGDNA
jgi:hypothetical protein